MFCPVPSSVPLTLFPCLFTVSYFYNIDIELISWNIIYQIWYLRGKKKKWQHAEKEAKHCALCSRDSPHKQAIETVGSESGLNLMPFLRGLSVFMVSSCRSPSGKRYSHLFFNHQKTFQSKQPLMKDLIYQTEFQFCFRVSHYYSHFKTFTSCGLLEFPEMWEETYRRHHEEKCCICNSEESWNQFETGFNLHIWKKYTMLIFLIIRVEDM